jgi:hypothetical protein
MKVLTANGLRAFIAGPRFRQVVTEKRGGLAPRGFKMRNVPLALQVGYYPRTIAWCGLEFLIRHRCDLFSGCTMGYTISRLSLGKIQIGFEEEAINVDTEFERVETWRNLSMHNEYTSLSFWVVPCGQRT